MYKKIISVMSVALVVFLCASPVFATSNGAAQRYAKDTVLYNNGTNGQISSHIYLTSFQGYRSDSQNGTNYFNWECDVLGYLVVLNNDSKDFTFNVGSGLRNWQFKYTVQQANPAGVQTDGTNILWNLTDVEYIGGQLHIAFVQNNDIMFQLYSNYSDDYLRPIIIPGNSSVCCYFKLHYTALMPPAGVQLYNPSFNNNSVTFDNSYSYTGVYQDVHENYQSYIPDIYEELINIYSTNNQQLSVLQQILASYNSNVPASQNVTQDASDSSTVIGNQHQQETNIYSQTNQAIGSTGIQNFQFDSQTIGGLGGVKNDFMAVWNSLGTFNSIFITSLTIGLALSIVRHRRMFKQ